MGGMKRIVYIRATSNAVSWGKGQKPKEEIVISYSTIVPGERLEATLEEGERWRRVGENDEGGNISVKWEYAIKICQMKIIIYTSYGLSKEENHLVTKHV